MDLLNQKKLVKIGKIVNTHGIKGELKIKSKTSFSNNDFVFTKYIYVAGQEYETKNYRKHKSFHLLTLKNFSNINEVLFLKGNEVYVEEKFLKDVNFDKIIGLEVINEKDNTLIGNVVNIMETKKYKILILSNDKLIPFINHFVVKKDKKKIWVKNYDQI